MPLLLTIGLAISLVTVALLLLTRRPSRTVPPPHPAPPESRSPVAEPTPARPGSGEPAFGAGAGSVVDSGRPCSGEPVLGAGAGLVVDPGPFGSRGWIMLDAERSALAWEPLAAVRPGPASASGRRRS
ncbi:hypothetical protein FHR83_002330 [Actinoplanes campanulatus]|uniref:Uncharacterized protein n=1 Tax=Actinoplanes campanulatus TaxID=113559 RepID=A0A7W5AE61_9ACTN|nr:hypothetical protein [Actinoplanes campanulatus]MBB3094667.1 hypothetical protein [Actinoplanes campanulatus]GGN06653.1 hypothetical protein GCM10010109_14550 [Actinoplanes campanulatus]GID35963.1 hypothetical protein Aca09nite_24690 [Actinoplanes campanulatus]